MPVLPKLFDDISDAAMFGASKILVDDKRYLDGNPHKDRITAHLKSAMYKAEGRHKFWVHKTRDVAGKGSSGIAESDTAGRKYVTLRVDATNGIISGDIFGDFQRTDWHFSWRSNAVFSIRKPSTFTRENWKSEGWDLFCVGTLFAPHGSDLNELQVQVAIAIKMGETKNVKAVRIFGCLPNGARKFDYSISGPDSPKRYKSFRYFAPVNLISRDLRNSEYKDLVDLAFGEDGKALKDMLAQTGTEINWDTTVNKLKTVDAGSVFGMLAPYQWSSNPYAFTALFAVENPGNLREGGAVPTLFPDNMSSNPRFAAVIYVRSIVNAYIKQVGGCWKDHKAALARRIQHVYIHELGHLLNIPHTWQRAQFAKPSFRADPDAISWMGYGSRFPLGNFMVSGRKWQAKQTGNNVVDLQDSDSHKVNETVLNTPGFTKEEELWIKHAPFDHISPGGPYFTKKAAPWLRLGKESAPANNSNYPSLRIELEDVAKDEGGVSLLRRGGHKDVQRQPLFGTVVLEVTKDFADRNPVHFAFQSAMLSLLVRAEYPHLPDRNSPRKVREYPAVEPPGNWGIPNESGDIVPFDVSRHFHEKVSSHSEEKTLDDGTEVRIFRRKLPLVNAAKIQVEGMDFFYSFGAKTHDYTIQATLLAQNYYRRLYSPQIPIRFVVGGLSYTKAEASILTDANFSILADLIAYLPTIDIAKLASRNLHSDTYKPDALTSLIERIRTLTDLSGLSPGLFAYLKTFSDAAQRQDEQFNELFFKTVNQNLFPDLQFLLQPKPDILERFQQFQSSQPNT